LRGTLRLAIANADGSDPRLVWHGQRNLQTFNQIIWSPDSRFVTATQTLSQDTPPLSSFIVASRADAASRAYVGGGGELPGGFSWSPDGEEFAVSVFVDEATRALDIRSCVGSEVRRLASGPNLYAVAWSPDGRTIAYTTSADLQGDLELWWIEVDGAQPRRVNVDGAAGYGQTAWSRDGRSLAFAWSAADAPTAIVTVLDRSGVEVGRIEGIPTGNLFMTWSPDSSAILFSTGGDQTGVGPTIYPIDWGPPWTVPVPREYYTACPLAWQVTTTQP
jgi:dipeptidyl aminopeptidase/acylaminoacyl peptidase